jgi:putative methanogenesis marker protein 12
LKFLGMDHGTNAIRFAVSECGIVRFFEISRAEAGEMDSQSLQNHIEKNLGFSLEEIHLSCLTYSMGDAISEITDILFVENRGVLSTDGVGEKTNAGTKVYDIFKKNNFSAILLPGLHRNSPTDSRMKAFSHQASPEKIAAAYHAYSSGHRRFILSDISSNTVTVAVADGKILGALDAAIFAPGTRHGPLDVEAIRDVDAGKKSANDAFSNAGVGDDFKTLAFFAAMEISAMDILMKEYEAADYDILLAGSSGEKKEIRAEIYRLLNQPPEVLGKWAAAVGCAEIAQAVAGGEKEILGISVRFER